MRGKKDCRRLCSKGELKSFVTASNTLHITISTIRQMSLFARKCIHAPNLCGISVGKADQKLPPSKSLIWRKPEESISAQKQQTTSLISSVLCGSRQGVQSIFNFSFHLVICWQFGFILHQKQQKLLFVISEQSQHNGTSTSYCSVSVSTEERHQSRAQSR